MEEEIRNWDDSRLNRQQRQRAKKMDVWSRTTFQRVFLKSLVRLVIYLYKLYQDFVAVDVYRKERALYFEIISLLCLILPSLAYAIYQSIAEFIQSDDISAKKLFTKFVNGLLLMPWQIKRHLDGLYFSAQNLCSFRPVREDEKENLFFINRNAETLEFFEDLYAGFLQVVLQLYLLTLETQHPYSIIFAELIGSALSIFSMLVAVRRRDDGWFTGILSFVGWTSMFASRVLAFALATTILKYWILLPTAVHVIGFTIWVYIIAQRALEEDPNPSPSRAKRRGCHLLMLVFIFFGLPSLVIWPIMFHLKRKNRPLKFLVVCFVENLFLVLVWYFCKKLEQESDKYFFLAVILTTLVATIFLWFYTYCKPASVDQVVLHEMRYSDTESFGIYFEFCDIVFDLKVERDVKELLEVIRSQPNLQPQSPINQQPLRVN